MNPWNRTNRFTDPQASAETASPEASDAAHHPLGFADVRDTTPPPVSERRRPVGFAPVEWSAPEFRTEISFRREFGSPARGLPVAGETTLGVGHAGEPGAVVTGPAVSSTATGIETFAPLHFVRRTTDVVASAATPPAGDAEQKVPFYKREISFRRKQADVAAPAEAVEPVEAVEAVAEEPVAEEPMLEAPVAEEPAVGPPVVEEPETVEAATLPEPELVEAHADDSEAIGEPPGEPEVEAMSEGVEDTENVTSWADADDTAELAFDEMLDGLIDEPMAEKVVEENAQTPVAESSQEAPKDEAPEEEAPEEVAAVAPSSGRKSIRLKSGGPTPKKRQKGGAPRAGKGRTIGLKIGASQIAAAVVSNSDGRSELVQLARTPLEEGIVVDGEVRDPAALTAALKSFFDEHKLQRRDVRLGVSSNRIGVRTFDIVGIEDGERFDNAVRFKAHEVLPVAGHESVLDYRVLDERVSEAGEALRHVLLVVAPRDQVEPYIDVCREAGIRLSGIDLEALGLLRTFVDPKPVTSRTVDDTATVVVSVGHESTTLLVAGAGMCEFTRVFDWGGGTLRSAVAQELEIHEADATSILRNISLAGSTGGDGLDDDHRLRAVDAVRTRLTPFARELVASLQFYQTQTDSLGIGEIVLTGGTSQLPGLADSLHQMIGVAVRVGDPLQRVIVQHGAADSFEATLGSLAVPIGLGIDEGSSRGVNLLPKDVKQAARRKPNFLAIGAPFAVVVPVAALAFMFMQAGADVADQQASLDAVRSEIAALPEPVKPLIDPSIASKEALRAQALASVLGGRVQWDGVLSDLSRVLPENVSLTDLTAKIADPVAAGIPAAPVAAGAAPAPTGVRIAGITTDQRSVAALLARLRTVPSLGNIALESSQVAEKKQGGGKRFVRFVILADIANGGAS